MSNVSRSEFEELKKRLEELEDKLGETTPEGPSNGLDHRDRSVLNYMRENGVRSKRALVNLYLARTDIQNRKTAKRRTKNLEQTEEYEELYK